jgi:hypothetical protein
MLVKIIKKIQLFSNLLLKTFIYIIVLTDLIHRKLFIYEFFYINFFLTVLIIGIPTIYIFILFMSLAESILIVSCGYISIIIYDKIKNILFYLCIFSILNIKKIHKIAYKIFCIKYSINSYIFTNLFLNPSITLLSYLEGIRNRFAFIIYSIFHRDGENIFIVVDLLLSLLLCIYLYCVISFFGIIFVKKMYEYSILSKIYFYLIEPLN